MMTHALHESGAVEAAQQLRMENELMHEAQWVTQDSDAVTQQGRALKIGDRVVITGWVNSGPCDFNNQHG